MQRRHGFETAIAWLGGSFRADWYVDLTFDSNTNQSHIRRWLEAWRVAAPRDRPTALFVVHPELGGFVAECERLKIRIPQDISIVAVAETQESTWISEHRFTFLRADFARMASRAIDAAQEIIDGRPRAPSIGVLSNEGRTARLYKTQMLLVPGTTVAAL